MPSEEFIRFREGPPAFKPPDLKNTTDFKRMRQAREAAFLAQRPAPAGVEYLRVDVSGVGAEWVVPPNSLKEKAILYLHGGGFTEGSVATHRRLTAAIARSTGISLLALEYRLAPEDPYPAALDDCVAAYRWLRQSIPAEGIVIAGDSAGGNLSLASALRLKDEGDELPAAVVALAPVTDFLATGASHRARADDPMAGTIGDMVGIYAPGQDPKNPYISPLYGEYSGFPPVLLQVGTADILLDDAVMLAGRAGAQGADVTLKIWEDMGHVFVGDVGCYPEADAGLREIAEFIRGTRRA